MTVSSQTSKMILAGDGSSTVFPVLFYFLDATHLKVIVRAASGTETVKTLGTDYTVTGAGVPAGGSIALVSAPSAGTSVIISRNVPLTQEVDYQSNDSFPSATHEMALDKATMIAQQLNDAIGDVPYYASAAAASAAAASTSATGANTDFLNFDKRYLGSKSVAPTLDNQGAALANGAMYFSTSTNAMQIWNGSVWAAAYVSGSTYALLTGAAFKGAISAPTVAANSYITVGATDAGSISQGFNVKNLYSSSSNFAFTYYDSYNENNRVVGSYHFNHNTDGSCDFSLAVTPAGSRTTDRRIWPLFIRSDGNIFLDNSLFYGAKDTGGSYRFLLGISGDNWTRMSAGGPNGFDWQNQTFTEVWARLTAGGFKLPNSGQVITFPDGTTQGTAAAAGSIGSNGWVKLSNGLIVQWGLTGNIGATPSNIVFPTTFPNSCFNIVATVYTGDGYYSNEIGVWVTWKSSSSFNVVARVYGGGAQNKPVSWIAIGY